MCPRNRRTRRANAVESSNQVAMIHHISSFSRGLYLRNRKVMLQSKQWNQLDHFGLCVGFDRHAYCFTGHKYNDCLQHYKQTRQEHRFNDEHQW
jgi:hypothetical protein